MPIMDKINELQNTETSKITSPGIGNISKKTQIFDSRVIHSYVFITGLVNGT